MEQQMHMMKQIIDLQRIALDGTISNALMFWEQTSQMMNTFLEQAGWLPEETKSIFREWVNSNKRGCETFKDAVGTGYNNLEKCVAGYRPEQKAA